MLARHREQTQREILEEIMDEEDIAILEDVIRLSRAAEDEEDWRIEGALTRVCHFDEDMCALPGMPEGWLTPPQDR